jgi:hypothetical protein
LGSNHGGVWKPRAMHGRVPRREALISRSIHYYGREGQGRGYLVTHVCAQEGREGQDELRGVGHVQAENETK